MIKKLFSKLAGSKEEDSALTADQLHRAPLEDVINAAWKWCGVQVIEVWKTSPFGHIIFKDSDDKYWFIDQDELVLEKFATDEAGVVDYFDDPENEEIWTGGDPTASAKDKLEEPDAGYCYGFKVPPIFGGEFNVDNLTCLPIRERIIFGGETARQLKDIPDGQEIQLKIVD